MEGHSVKARTRDRAVRPVQLLAALAAAGLLAGSVSTGGGEGTAPTMLIPGGDGNVVTASGPIDGSTAVGAQRNHFAGGRQPTPPDPV